MGIKRTAIRLASAVATAGLVAVAGAPASEALVQPKPLTQNYHSEGPVAASDIDLLTKVAQANMWEGGVSEQIAQMTTNDAVRLVAQRLAADHKALESATQDLADEYGIVLPNQATRQQQSWVAQILAQHGDSADRTYINIVRAAHGTIFQTIANVRSSTQNDDFRAYAQTANTVVMRHMTLLEGSGLAQTTSLVVDPISTSVTNQPNLTIGKVLLSTLGAIVACVLTVVLVRRFGRWGQAEVS